LREDTRDFIIRFYCKKKIYEAQRQLGFRKGIPEEFDKGSFPKVETHCWSRFVIFLTTITAHFKIEI
jgi:hypothetical protein